MSYYKDQKFHTKSMEEKFKKINFPWHYSIKSSLRQVINHLSLVHVHIMHTAVDSGGLKTNCDHQQFLRSGTTWQCLTGSG